MSSGSGAYGISRMLDMSEVEALGHGHVEGEHPLVSPQQKVCGFGCWILVGLCAAGPPCLASAEILASKP